MTVPPPPTPQSVQLTLHEGSPPAPAPRWGIRRAHVDAYRLLLYVSSLGSLFTAIAIDPHPQFHWLKIVAGAAAFLSGAAGKALEVFFIRVPLETAAVRDEETGSIERVPVAAPTPPAPGAAPPTSTAP